MRIIQAIGQINRIYGELSEDNKMALDVLIEKQIAKKPIVIQKGKVEEGGCYGVFYCPSCYELDGHKDWKCKVIFDQNYCECCGQKIDWSGYD